MISYRPNNIDNSLAKKIATAPSAEASPSTDSTQNNIATTESTPTNPPTSESTTTLKSNDITKQKVNYMNKKTDEKNDYISDIERQLRYIITELQKIQNQILSIDNNLHKHKDLFSKNASSNSDTIEIIKVLLKDLTSDIERTINSIEPANGSCSSICQFTPSEFVELCFAIYGHRIRHIATLIDVMLNTDNDGKKINRNFSKLKTLCDDNYPNKYPIVLFSQRYYNPDIRINNTNNPLKHLEKSTVSYLAAALFNPLHINPEQRRPLGSDELELKKDSTGLTIEIYPGRCNQDDIEVSYFAVNNRTYAQHCIRGIPPRFVPIMPIQELMNRLSNEDSNKNKTNLPFGEAIEPERSKNTKDSYRYDTEISGLKLLCDQENENIEKHKNTFRIHKPNQPFSLDNLLYFEKRTLNELTVKPSVSQHTTSSSTRSFGMFNQAPINAPEPVDAPDRAMIPKR